MHRAGNGDALHLVNVAQAVKGDSFNAPGPGDFEFPPLFGEGTFFTKPMLIIVLGTALIGLLFWVASRRASLVPAKAQFLGESLYGFVRNDIVGDTIGAEGRKFVPYLTTLFVYIAVMDLFGIVPIFQLPATSKIGIPLFLAVVSWGIFNVVGIQRHGFLGYFKAMCFPPGLPKVIYVLLAPLEFFSTFIIRPITLTLRLTLNMFAGHLVLLVTILGGAYLLEQGGALAFFAPVAWLFSIVLTFFEAFIQLLQAYVFVLLSALYIAGALADEH